MDILVDRFISDDDTTISRVLIDGKFCCFGLEDEYREEKLANETRIPYGKYTIQLKKSGGFHDRYKKRFPDIHNGMLHVQDVPNFKWILIHCGNTDKHTAGCLLVGSQAITEPGDMSITNSTSAYRRLYTLVIDAAINKELGIEFVDNDR